MLQKRVVTYEPITIERADLVTLAEAVRITGLTSPGLIRAVERGQLTEIIDTDAGYHGRRLLLREEVERFRHGRVAG
jgi:hypothetical protein